MQDKTSILCKKTSILCCVLLLSGCSLFNQTSEIDIAESAITDAKNNYALLYAKEDIELAEKKLNSAQQSEEQHEYDEAKKLAQKASSDAHYAKAKALDIGYKKMLMEQEKTMKEMRRIYKIKLDKIKQGK